MRAALETNHGRPDAAVMVGDRRHDAAGSAANGVPCIGVLWGFAPEGEFAALDLAAVAGTAEELEEAILAALPGGHAAPAGSAREAAAW